MSVHTPRPWFLEPLDLTVYDGPLPDSQAIAVAESRSSVAEQESNARLIAAAPDLLVALKDANEALANFYSVEPRMAGEYFGAALAERIEAAIATAEQGALPRTVVVEVTGGTAEVTTCPEDIEVEIIDHDDA